MTLSVKQKIWLGTLFLFLLLLLTGGVGIYHMAKLKKDGQNVLKANYESLSYCHIMQQQLINYESGNKQSLKELSLALAQQEKNITEPGEEKATSELRTKINKLESGDNSKNNLRGIESDIQRILSLNMQAIQRKSKIAERTADNALTIIIALGSFVFLVALSFIVNFPSIVTSPIYKLEEAIKEIANKNYTHRVHVDNSDEFGRLADAFNDMAERLQYLKVAT